jgi:hypothetical protein
MVRNVFSPEKAGGGVLFLGQNMGISPTREEYRLNEIGQPWKKKK